MAYAFEIYQYQTKVEVPSANTCKNWICMEQKVNGSL